MRVQKYYKEWLVLFFVFAFSFLFRSVFAFFPPRLLVYEPQELSVLFAVMGLFAGLPPAATTLWSIGSISLPLLLIFGIDFIFRSSGVTAAFFSHDPSTIITHLSAYLARVFLDPTRNIIIARIVVSLISAVVPVALFSFFKKQRMNCAAVVSALLFSTSPFLVLQGAMVMTDALGFTFFTLFLTQMLDCQEKKRGKDIILMGAFYGAAVAGKFPYLAFLPAAMAGMYWLGHRLRLRAIKDLFIFLFSAGAVLLILIPFAWLDPVALLKNITGNLAMDYVSKAASAQAFYWTYLLRDCGTLFMGWKGWLVFVPVGVIASFILLGRKRAVITMFGCSLFLLPLGFSHSAYTRYAMPLFLFVGIYVAVFLEFLVRGKKRMFRSFFVFLFAFFIAAINIRALAGDFKRAHASDNLTDCIAWAHANVRPPVSIALPRELSFYFHPDAFTARKWRDIYEERYRHLEDRIRIYFSLNQMQLGAQNKNSPLIPAVFGSVEKQKIFQYELLLWYYAAFGQPSPAFEITLYDEIGSDAVTISFSEACDLFVSHKINVMVSSCPLRSKEPLKMFDRYGSPVYYVYGNQNLK